MALASVVHGLFAVDMEHMPLAYGRGAEDLVVRDDLHCAVCAVLSIRMVSTDSIETLKDRFTPAALESVTVGEGEAAKTIAGYTQVDSIRKLYDGKME